MLKVVVATRNRKKLEELRRLLEGLDVELFSLEGFPSVQEVIEDGMTFEENAIKKAISVARATGFIAIADDSGLVVDGLGGAPGVFSARYAGEPSDDRRNIEKLLREMQSIPHDKRQAHFVCIIALASPDGTVKTFKGQVDGIITMEPRGDKGFGYDPVFEPEGFDKTFAEMSPQEKDSISHRMKAVAAFRRYLEEVLKNSGGKNGMSKNLQK